LHGKDGFSIAMQSLYFQFNTITADKRSLFKKIRNVSNVAEKKSTILFKTHMMKMEIMVTLFISMTLIAPKVYSTKTIMNQMS